MKQGLVSFLAFFVALGVQAEVPKVLPKKQVRNVAQQNPPAKGTTTAAPQTPVGQTPTSAPVQNVAPAQAAPPVAAPSQPEAADSTSSASSGGNHMFGPSFILGVPHPIQLGVDYVHPSSMFSAGLSLGAYNMKVTDADAKLTNSEIALRYHPFAGSFFVGASLGNHKVTVEKTDEIDVGGTPEEVTGKIELKANYIKPHIGWMKGASDGGFYYSFEIGLVSPSGVKTDFTSDADAIVQADPDYEEFEKDLEDDGNKIGKQSLPYLALIKVGWLF